MHVTRNFLFRFLFVSYVKQTVGELKVVHYLTKSAFFAKNTCFRPKKLHFKLNLECFEREKTRNFY